jgi:hypothetical protein
MFEHAELAPMDAFQKVFMAKQGIIDGSVVVPYLPYETPPDWDGSYEPPEW